MSKRILVVLGLIALCVVSAFADFNVREKGYDCRSGAVSVSTTTPTLVPSAALDDRYRIDVINTDNTYDVAFGTSSVVTYAGGYIVTNSTDAATAKHTFFYPYNKTLYGLGEANTVRGTVNVRYWECK
jgi:hypothetical protein